MIDWKIRERIDILLHPNKLKAFNLKFPKYMIGLPPKPFPWNRSLIVLASNKEEATLMRTYLIEEEIEG